MSREGEWRLTTSMLRVAGAAFVFAGVAWGAWEVAAALAENPAKTPAAAKALPVKNLELTTDGVLGKEWLARTLVLPKAPPSWNSICRRSGCGCAAAR